MLTLWRPHRELFNWGRELEDFFSGDTNGFSAQSFAPAVDVEDGENSLTLRADLPGISEKEIDVSVHEGTLTLSGKREEREESKKGGAVIRERRYGSFSRSFRLGSNYDAENIKATYKNGVLTVEVPKRAEAKPRQIPVKGN